MVKVKICGITNLDDARTAVRSGCDALGFVFFSKSPRYITPKKAADIIKRLPKKILKAGVFVNARPKTIKDIAKLCRLDMLQLHGNESVLFCKRFSKHKVIKAFRVKDSINPGNVLKYRTWGYLFDTFQKQKVGGTGRNFDWGLLKGTHFKDKIVFLSGGLSQKNVRKAIRIVNPDWVDVSSAVEINPGKKDHAKIKSFVGAVKS